MVILEIREPLTINQIMDFQNFIALYNPDERNNCRSRQQMTDRAFFWHNGLQKLTKPRHTESKPKPHNSKPNSFILTSVPNPESQGALGVLKDGIWFQQRTKGLQLRAAGNLFTHGTRPASSSTSHFLGNWHLWLRLCEVAPSKSWPPPPNNICLKAAPGGRLWGVGVGESCARYLSTYQRKWWRGATPTIICVFPNAQAHWHATPHDMAWRSVAEGLLFQME